MDKHKYQTLGLGHAELMHNDFDYENKMRSQETSDKDKDQEDRQSSNSKHIYFIATQQENNDSNHGATGGRAISYHNKQLILKIQRWEGMIL